MRRLGHGDDQVGLARQADRRDQIVLNAQRRGGLQVDDRADRLALLLQVRDQMLDGGDLGRLVGGQFGRPPVRHLRAISRATSAISSSSVDT